MPRYESATKKWVNDNRVEQVFTNGNSTASTTFPITLNDGTYTYTITATGGELILKIVKNSNAKEVSINLAFGTILGQFSDGNIEATPDLDWVLNAGRDWFLYAVGDGLISPTGDLTITAGGNVNVGTAGNVMGFFGATAITQPTVTGSKISGAALASLLTELANLGLIVDGTSA